jgi:hypothetical protein
MKRINKARISKYRKNKKKVGGNNYNDSISSSSSNDSIKSTSSTGSTNSTSSISSTTPVTPKVPVASGNKKSTSVVSSNSIFHNLSSRFKNFSFKDFSSSIKNNFNSTMKKWFPSNDKTVDKKKITGGKTRRFKN